MQNSGSAVPSTSDSQSTGDEGWQTRQRRFSEPQMIEMGEHSYIDEVPTTHLFSLVSLPIASYFRKYSPSLKIRSVFSLYFTKETPVLF